MPSKSRYATRCNRLDRTVQPVEPLLHIDSRFSDIAAGKFGRVQVHLWLKGEHDAGGREWGSYGTSYVGILPFTTKAQLNTENISLQTFDVDLFVTEFERGLGPETFPELCQGDLCHTYSNVCLIGHPAPGNIDSHPKRRSWTFSSNVIQDCDRMCRAAKWTWESKGHKPLLLHGAMAVQHQGRVLRIACRTRGKMSLPVRGRLRIRLDFNNDESSPVWWPILPLPSDVDLSARIAGLEAEMQQRNQSWATSSHSGAPSHRFEAVNISGNANVIVGSGTFSHAARGSPSSTHPTQPDFQASRIVEPRGPGLIGDVS